MGPIDPDRPDEPNLARVWDFLVKGDSDGGYSLPADRARARDLMAADPAMQERVRVSRQFACTAARRAAAAGARQVIDLGSGLPASPAVHGGRSALVECDELAAAMIAAEYEQAPGIAVVNGDLGDPAAILADPALLGVIDLAEPACVVLGSVLYAREPQAGAEITRAYMTAAAPGSWLVATAPFYADPELLDAVRKVACTDVHSYTPGAFGALFGGLDLIAPGVASARFWLAGLRRVAPGAGVTTLCAAGVKR